MSRIEKRFPHEFYLYYAGMKDGREAIGCAYADRMGQWTQSASNPVVPEGASGEFDSGQTSNPCVVRNGGSLLMLYQGRDDLGMFRIGRADSEDGENWVKRGPRLWTVPPGTPGSFASRDGCHHPHIVREGDNWRVYHIRSAGMKTSVHVALTKDFETFELLDGTCLPSESEYESYAVYYPWVMKNGDGWVMWYSAVQTVAGDQVWHLARAVSEDGLLFQRSPEEPIVRGRSVGKFAPRHILNSALQRCGFRGLRPSVVSIANPSVVKIDGSLTMYFHAILSNRLLSIGSARSDDGIAWRDFSHHVVGQRQPWAADFDADPFVFMDGVAD